ncbi:MAG TPA: helicase RepA family protein [Terriglobia bacterium]|nr:helicase RepA family protein [Terriglobia bacterium]
MVYDDDTKIHSHHDTDPARGQHSAFDLVRLHRFGHLDAGAGEAAVTDRPSYHAMVEWANSLDEIRIQRAGVEFENLGELPPSPVGTTDDQPDRQPRFTVYSADDFSSGAPLEWLVRRVLPRAELAVVFGESGSGKSFFALDLCAAITRGIEWRTNRVARGGVVYVCAEGARGFKARLHAYSHEHEVAMAKLPAVIADAPNLLEPKDAAALTQAIVTWVQRQGKVDVVVIDTLSATTPGGNENSGEDMGLVLSHCRFISKQTGALVVLIHHSGKDSTRGARGWSGLRAAADAEIEIVRNGDYRVANVTKMKDGTDGESFPFKLKVVDLGFDPDGEAQSSCVVEHVEAQPAAPSTGKQRATGRHQITMLEVLRTVAPSGTVNYDDLVAGYVAKMPKGDARDNRKRDAKRALEELITKKLAFMHGEDRVSLTSLVTSGDEGWLG